jgi:hypothetical protein
VCQCRQRCQRGCMRVGRVLTRRWVLCLFRFLGPYLFMGQCSRALSTTLLASGCKQ